MNIDRDLDQTFCGILGYDALEAMVKMDSDSRQSTRRNFVRAAFAAIEGWLWTYRQNVQEMLETIRDLSHLEKAAFAEKSFYISSSGKLQDQVKFVPAADMFRFVTRTLEEELGERLIDFASAEWQSFNKAFIVRHRITHPKEIGDLALSDQEIELVRNTLLWFFHMVVSGIEKTQSTLVQHASILREFLDDLRSGNAAAFDVYNNGVEGEM